MSEKGKEIEVKFYISNALCLQQRLEALGAACEQPRVYEANLRFDTPDRQLSRSLRALRLRMDTAARMTYKGPPLEDAGARLRKEVLAIAEERKQQFEQFMEQGRRRDSGRTPRGRPSRRRRARCPGAPCRWRRP